MMEERALSRCGGYTGRIGHINLSCGRVWFDEHDATRYRRYGGGGALAAWYLLHDIPVGADPLGPDNVLVFASSIVGGIGAPAVSRHAVLAMSPLSGVAGESQPTGTFGPALKRSGFDAIVIHAVAERPCYIVARDGELQAEDASELWGQDTADAHEALRALEGDHAHTALIGVAGENLVRFASIVNVVQFMSCRTGMGAVMGAKRLRRSSPLRDRQSCSPSQP
jgi:aldehyde:ferredoxin oxidoreductase